MSEVSAGSRRRKVGGVDRPVLLISLTPDAEELILYIARASSDQTNEDPGLLRYLIRQGHWSPFEHAHATFAFTTSRVIAAQMLRHRSFSFQEFSQRYAEPQSFIAYAGRTQAEHDRQSSVDALPVDAGEWWIRAQEEVAEHAWRIYRTARRYGVARECARMVLPLSTETKLYMTGSLRSWIHYFALRCDEHTQAEHRDLALEARRQLAEHLPVIAEAAGWGGVT